MTDVEEIYSHGIATDMIIASYITIMPLLLTCVQALSVKFNVYNVLLCYNIVISFVVSLLLVADTVLYKFWQYKIDSSIFMYMKSIRGMFASVKSTFIILGLIVVMTVAVMQFVLIQWITSLYFDDNLFYVTNIWGCVQLVFVFMTCAILSFVIIRGLKIRPNNPSIAYYSKHTFYNHCAVNPLYNFIYSLSLKDEYKDKFRFFEDSKCEETFKQLYPTNGTPQLALLNTERPNILVIIWESLCARYIESLGGERGVTTNFERLSEEGVFFTRCDAGSFRTDRGLVCILGGYPGQPTASVINYSRKLPKLSALPRRLRNIGYTTMAVHGGNLSIMHKSDYYLTSGHDILISQKDFAHNAPSCKWGINDDYVFSWLYDDIQTKTKNGVQWYTTFQTLSSHEPFDVPKTIIKDNKIHNSFAYTDECFGTFIDNLKETPAWDNLLIVCVGDHGANFGNPISNDEYPHIPLLFLGGAVNEHKVIDTIISQTDIAATILGQLHLSHDEFIYSRDVLADSYVYPFSFYAYNNGFVLRDNYGFTDYDNVAGVAVEGGNERRELIGKAVLQTLYDDLSKK